MFKTNFLTDSAARALAQEHGTPLYVYSRQKLAEQAEYMLSIKAPYGLTVRYAMKANSHPEILRLLLKQGVMIDASSEHEVQKALDVGFAPTDILLTSQQLAKQLEQLVNKGVGFNATSLRQLEEYGKLFPGSDVSVRINPGVGSGHSVKVTVGGRTSSFGIWHEYIPRVHEIAQKYNLTIRRLLTHIGAGTDPLVWQEAARISMELIKNFPKASVLNLGGGFKVARMDDEHGADMSEIGDIVVGELKHFKEITGRELHLELEPGTFMVANVGLLLASVDDIVDTGAEGYTFLKLDTGMNDILRPTMYGSQHPIQIVNKNEKQEDYILVGHNCESGDLLTPAPGDPEVLLSRTLNKASIGDVVIIGGVGAYCASMAAHGYNSYPNAVEIVI